MPLLSPFRHGNMSSLHGLSRSFPVFVEKVCITINMNKGETLTPLVLQRKSFTKTCHEHHVYVLMHVIKCVDQFP